MPVDVVMPERDRHALAVERRKAWPTLRVFFISAFAPDRSRQPSPFLATQFTSEALAERVERSLSS